MELDLGFWVQGMGSKDSGLGIGDFVNTGTFQGRDARVQGLESTPSDGRLTQARLIPQPKLFRAEFVPEGRIHQKT